MQRWIMACRGRHGPVVGQVQGVSRVVSFQAASQRSRRERHRRDHCIAIGSRVDARVCTGEGHDVS